MSLLSSHIGLVAPPGQSGATPADELFAKLTVAAAVFFVSLEVAYLTLGGLPPIGKPWVDGTHFVFGRDFLNTWMGARSVFHGGPAVLFDARTYNAALRDMLGTVYPEHFWSYPPHVLLFIWPFGLMPYLPAYIAWCAIGVALYLLACSSAIQRRRMLFLAAAPGVTVCIFFGQNGFYSAALLIGGLLCLDRRPVLAGILFGILTIKPQLGLLVPVVLLLERRWVTIMSAVATTAVLFAATTMLFGWNAWVEFWQKVIPQQEWLTAHGGGLLFEMVSSVFYAGRLLHLPLAFDWALQGIVSALALAAVVWTYWQRRDPALLAGAVRHRDLSRHAIHSQLRHGDLRLRGGAAARPRRRHQSRSLAARRAVDAAGCDDDGGRRLHSAGADRADRVRVPIDLAHGAKRSERNQVAVGNGCSRSRLRARAD